MASNKNNVIGFHYEPELSDTDAVSGPEYDSESGNEGEEACVQGRRAASVEEWCQCHKCEKMASEQECVCCHEIDEIKYFKLGEMKCITDHEDFHAVILLKNTLWTALVALHDRESKGLPNREQVPNRAYRYAAYRQFTWFIHSHLGRGVRRIIPSCVISKIRNQFPEKDGNYVGFKGNEMVCEADVDWEEWAKDIY